MIQAHHRTGVDEVRGTEDVRRLLDLLSVAEDATLVHRDTPDNRVWVGVRGDRGAMLFTDVFTGSWASLGEGPRLRPRYAGVRFPTHCEIPVADLAVAIEEFLATGQRPTRVPWQQVR
ncbi:MULTISPECIES: Imm1 family immunity protein [unclassified Saccharothrix]|uniref:Imm1 family immunity protein n=1 Tax=unclassified Saccharothrix TaxID=2593673 RepID=UPI00307EDDD7